MRVHITEEQLMFTKVQSMCLFTHVSLKPVAIYTERKQEEATMQTNLPPNAWSSNLHKNNEEEGTKKPRKK